MGTLSDTLSAAVGILRGQVAPAGVGTFGQPTQERAVSSSSKGFTIVAGKGGGRTVTIDHDAREYSASAVAYRCVDAIAKGAAQVNMGVLRSTGDFDLDHPAARLWNRSVPEAPLSAWSVRYTIMAQLQLRGEAFAYVDRGENGTAVEPLGLWPIYDRIEIVVTGSANGAAGRLEGYIVHLPGGKRVPLLPQEVLWLRFPDPFTAWGALAPWKAALHAVEVDSYARGHQRATFENGAQMSAVVYLGDLTDEQHTRALAEFQSRQGGSVNAGRPFLTSTAPPEPGAQRANTPQVQELSMSPVDVQLLESRTSNAEEVMLAFGVPRDYLLGGTTYENRAAAKATLWSDKIVGDLDVVAAEYDRQLLPSEDEAAGFDLTDVDALQESTDAVWDRVRGIAYTDVNTLDELREMLGYEPLPDGLGALTLTAYRARVNAETAAEFAPEEAARAALAGTPGRVAHRGQLVRVRSTTRLIPRPRPATRTTGPALVRAKPRRVSRPQVLKFYDTHEGIGRRTVQRIAEKQRRVVMRNLSRLDDARVRELVAQARADDLGTTSSPWSQRALAIAPAAGVRIAADDLFDVRHWRDATEEAAETWVAGVWEQGGATFTDAIGLSFDRFEPKVLNATRDRVKILADQTTETTRKILEAELLAHGLEEGESIDDLRDRITSVFTDLAGYRADAIARTETVGGFNGATRIIGMESGLVQARLWLATTDSRTRESHAAQDGQRVQGWDTRYDNGCLYPGDPTADAGETINCRCVEEMEVVDE